MSFPDAIARGAAEPFIGAITQPMTYAATWPLYQAVERLCGKMAAHAAEIDITDALPGDIRLCGAGRGPAHYCGFLREVNCPLYRDREAGAVVEQDLTGFWIETTRAAFRLPGIA